MITTGLNGRLGNHMFQVAAATALAYENYDVAQFDLNTTDAHNYENTIYSKTIVGKGDYINEYSQPVFTYRKIPYVSNLKLWGYFQSEKFFKNYKKEIVDLFSNELLINNLRFRYKDILKNSLSINIRRGDYLYYPDIHPCLSPEYYLEGIKYVENILPIDNILVFSDDIPYCKSVFNNDKMIFMENLPHHEQMYLMSLCDNNILANSTFSWWASYLNKNEDKIVIFPKIWFGTKAPYDPSDIYWEDNIIKI